MQDNPLNLGLYRCNEKKFLLIDCNSKLRLDKEEYDEHKVLLLRAGMNPEKFDCHLEICIAHRDLLGKKFSRYHHPLSCQYRGHVDRTNRKLDKHGRQITYWEAVAAHKCENLQLPLSLPICRHCYNMVSEKHGTVPMVAETSSESVLSPEQTVDDPNWEPPKEEQAQFPDNFNFQSLSQEISRIPRTRAMPQSQPEPEVDSIAQPEQHPRAAPIPATRPPASKVLVDDLNNFMKARGAKKFPGRFVRVHYETCTDPSRKQKVLKAAAAAVGEVIKTVSEHRDDWIVLYGDLKGSRLVEDYLGFDPRMSKELQQIVTAWNRAPNYPVRIQVICFVVLCYKFCVLDRFNKKSIASDREKDDSEIDISKTGGLHFEPPLSLHIYNEALQHARNSVTHGGIEQVVRQPAVKWPFSLKVVTTIQAYVMHPAVTQIVAYGTRQVKTPYGGTTTIANIYRRFSDRETARQIEDHLKVEVPDEPHPSRSTILRMLQNMPASKTRSLEVSIPGIHWVEQRFQNDHILHLHSFSACFLTGNLSDV